MGLLTFPTNIGGIQLPFNQLEGPLASLFSTDKAQNLTYPSDLASNPTMCHAVQFSVHDWTTELASMFASGVDVLSDLAKTGINTSIGSMSGKLGDAAKEAFNNPTGTLTKLGDNIGPNAIKLGQAKTYKQNLSAPLANINLYMPDTLVNEFSSNYDEISLTQKLGIPGVAISSAQDLIGGQLGSTTKDVIGNIVNAVTTKSGATSAVSAIAEAMKSKTGQGLLATALNSDLLSSSFGVGLNPQVQLIYKGVNLRTFTLEFIFTPKNAREAETTKQIIDAFNYFSLPSLSGPSGQYLVAPQIFKIKFAFTGASGISGALGNIFQQAFNNIGLGFLNPTDRSGTITNASNAKVYSIPHPCVLKSVNVDYAPNGWAAYNDGHPIQSRMVLVFEETQIVTKESYEGSMNKGWVDKFYGSQMITNTPYTSPSPTGPGTFNVGGSEMTITPLGD